MKQYIVDAFTKEPFRGNPAAVCVLNEYPSGEYMKKLARENSLSETAYLVKEEGGYHLRWFTPGEEVTLCGHATLASSYVLFRFYEKKADRLVFHTLSGDLFVKRKGDMIEMDFPIPEWKEVPVSDDMERAFGVRPERAYLGLDLLCVFGNEDDVRAMSPDQSLLLQLPGRLQNVTARGKDTDCVSRSFGPKVAVPEDPVCGSAHCLIADYWAKELGKNTVYAYQASARGGYLTCERREDGRMSISGSAVLVAVSDVLVEE